MSPEAQCIAIAEACGWRKGVEAKVGRTGIAWFRGPDDDLQDVIYHLPDYLSDLNAMHEAEEVLTGGLGSAFAHILHTLLCQHIWGDFPVIHAGAAQRAEAFLRTLNLWDDSK